MLGIPDPWIWGVYLLCIFSALLCVVYGLINWKNGEENVRMTTEANTGQGGSKTKN